MSHKCPSLMHGRGRKMTTPVERPRMGKRPARGPTLSTGPCICLEPTCTGLRFCPAPSEPHPAAFSSESGSVPLRSTVPICVRHRAAGCRQDRPKTDLSAFSIACARGRLWPRQGMQWPPSAISTRNPWRNVSVCKNNSSFLGIIPNTAHLYICKPRKG
ncbi:uncharacterized protein LOC122232990 isoform X2 [Panthera tigris]|uniref:uncharacterized protein LOC122232990 isoform X2 n=1 Tax=Panthera tigris TaxID=9694 RepID=UPI001C6FBC03|nr:uncharacterized protein LOC122232990 isoform X2 [Panthera tigris]